MTSIHSQDYRDALRTLARAELADATYLHHKGELTKPAHPRP